MQANSTSVKQNEKELAPQPTAVEGQKEQQKQCHSIFGNYDKNLILFAYNKSKDQNCPDEIMVLQQPKKKVKQETQSQAINNMMLNISLEGKIEQKLFLKKIDPFQRKEIAQEIKQMLSVANQLSLEDRRERRKEAFESSKIRRKGFQYASEDVMAKRAIKVVKMESLSKGDSIRGVVQLGEKQVQYQDLNMGESNQQFYTLIKKKVRLDQVYPEIQVQNADKFYEISYEPDQLSKEQDNYGEDYDSNDADNPNYDYPEEDESDRSSQDIIERDYDQYMDRESYKQDEEVIYQRYLRRLKKKEQEMDIEPEQEQYD